MPDFHLGKKFVRVFKFLVLGGIQSRETISEKFYPITFLAGEFRPRKFWFFIFAGY